MSDKMPQKFKMIKPDGTVVEIEVPASNVDVNHPLLTELQRDLLRLKAGEQLKLDQNHFDAVSMDPMELTIIGEIGAISGCDIGFDKLISDNPPKRGYIFTRLDHVPSLEWSEPEGGVQ